MNARSELLKQLEQEIRDFGGSNTKLTDDNLFVAWFLKAYLTDSESEAIKSTTGCSGDKGIDGIYINDKAGVAYLLQCKYHIKRYGKPETRSAVIAFANLAPTICDSDNHAFSDFIKTMDTALAEQLKEVRHRVTRRGYRLVLMFVTLGSCSRVVREDAEKIVRRALNKAASIDIFDLQRCLLLFSDYLDGAAPPIPTLDVPIESGGRVEVSGVLQRFDSYNSMESWVLPVRGDTLKKMYEIGGRRLFARNIRGFLGESTPINDEMSRTIREEPDRFFYFNNGITLVCDGAEEIRQRGTRIVKVTNPQIINGQQTSRVLSDAEGAKNASVLVKIIRVPRETNHSNSFYDDIINKIVQATNWQNPIRPSDLRANHRLQLALEKELRRLDYFYARKRQTKKEMRAAYRVRSSIVVTKEELAQAVAGCELDPTVARSGKDNLFGEDLYKKVFRNHDPNFYLPKYWLFKMVTKCAKGKPQRGYTKWVVLGFVWNSIDRIIQRKRLATSFSDACRNQEEEVIKPLTKAINIVYDQALSYYRENRGRGASEIDISLFFRSKKGRDKEFSERWRRRPRVYRQKYDSLISKISAALFEK